MKEGTDESQNETVAVTITKVDFELLKAFGKPEDVLAQVADHAAQGVYRPGAWERPWVEQVFGDDWQKKLVPGCPYGRPGCEHIFQQTRSLSAKNKKERSQS